MSVTGVAQSAQLTGQPSQLVHGDPLAVTQGVAPGVPRQGAPAASRRRAQHGGGHGRGRDSASELYSPRDLVRSNRKTTASALVVVVSSGGHRNDAGDDEGGDPYGGDV